MQDLFYDKSKQCFSLTFVTLYKCQSKHTFLPDYPRNWCITSHFSTELSTKHSFTYRIYPQNLSKLPQIVVIFSFYDNTCIVFHNLGIWVLPFSFCPWCNPVLFPTHTLLPLQPYATNTYVFAFRICQRSSVLLSVSPYGKVSHLQPFCQFFQAFFLTIYYSLQRLAASLQIGFPWEENRSSYSVIIFPSP